MNMNTSLENIKQSYLDIYNKYPDIQNSLVSKYFRDIDDYLREKSYVIDQANLAPNSHCLDISTGVGLLPVILQSQGHTCDCTDIDSFELDKDPQSGNQNLYKLIRTSMGINYKHLAIERQVPAELSTEYDCIFSTRIVFSKGWKDHDYEFFINDMLNYTPKCVFKWNISEEHATTIPDILIDNKLSMQFSHGFTTLHTRNI